MNRLVSLWKQWSAKAFLSIADQGMVSGATFVLNILLARWLSPSGYGAFAIGFSVFLFVTGFHNALVLEPMSVLGPARYGDLPVEYLGSLIWAHTGVSMCSLILVAAASFVFRTADTPVAGPLLGLALSSPAILTFWLLRRICYLKTRPDLALRGSLLYSLILVLGLIASYGLGWVSPFGAFLTLGISSIGASLLLWRSLNVGLKELSWARVKPAIPSFLSQHWKYARWVLGSAFVYWLSGAVYLPLIGSFAGLEPAGVFQAMQNLLKPLQNILTAFGLLFLPWVSRQRASQGQGYANRMMFKVLVMNFAVACVYLAPLATGRHWIVKLIYGPGYYDGFAWLLPYLCVASLIGSIMQGLTIWLKAFERPDAFFWSQTAGAVLTLSVGLYLVWMFKLFGATIGLILADIVMALVLLFFLFRSVRYGR